ncbi:hypothetical protein VPH35_061586 [Triticum aestivum]
MAIYIAREATKVSIRWPCGVLPPYLFWVWFVKLFFLLLTSCSYGGRCAPRRRWSCSFCSRSGTCYLPELCFSIFMDWLLEEYITCIGPVQYSRTWDLWPFRSLGKTKWSFHPFVYHSKRFYTVLLWRRVLAFLVASQFLRIITFYSTQLPGPNYHCREGSKLATLPPPKNVLEVLLINFPRGVLFGCGDLIFSSHMIFTLVFVRTYHKYGSKRLIKLFAWLMAIIQSLLIIASRKHYTVDVVVAWYTVNLVVFFVDKNLPEMLDRTSGLALLPVSAKDKSDRMKEELHKPEKDNKIKDEHHKLLNGNTVDSTDRRQWMPMNGKHGEDMNHTLSDAAPNGT